MCSRGVHRVKLIVRFTTHPCSPPNSPGVAFGSCFFLFKSFASFSVLGLFPSAGRRNSIPVQVDADFLAPFLAALRGDEEKAQGSLHPSPAARSVLTALKAGETVHPSIWCPNAMFLKRTIL